MPPKRDKNKAPPPAQNEEIVCLTIDLGEDPCNFGQTGDDVETIGKLLIENLKATDIPIPDVDGCSSVPVPVLCAKGEKPLYIDAKVKFQETNTEGNMTTYQVVFRIRRFDLYVLGYKAQDSDHFWEFMENPKDDGKLIPGSKSIGLTGNYLGPKSIGSKAVKQDVVPALNNSKKKTTTVEVSYRESLIMNRNNFAQHIKELCLNDPRVEPCIVSKALVHVLHLLAEVPRFTEILQHDQEQWNLKGGKAIPLSLTTKQNQWLNMSKDLQRKEKPDYSKAKELGIAKREEDWKSEDEKKEEENKKGGK